MLTTVDYEDRFTAATTAEATPEQWARAMFGDVPSPGEILIWRVILGLRLSHRRSPDTVGGWRVTGRGDDWIRLEAGSWFLSATMIVETGDEQVGLRTLVRYERAWGRAVWPPLSAVHRRLVPGVLRNATSRVRTRVR